MKKAQNDHSVINRLKVILLDGGRYTALNLGEKLKSQDIRKQISNLKKAGWDIKTLWLDGRKRKEYWLNPSQISELKEKEAAKKKRTITKD